MTAESATPVVRPRRRRVSPLRRLYVAAGRYLPQALLLTTLLAIVVVFIQGGPVLAGDQIYNAVVLGALYALVAVGYTMVYGIIELINFAHGDVFALSAFYAVLFDKAFHLTSLATSGGLGLLLALLIIFPLTMLAAGLTGVVIEFVAYRRLRNKPRLAPLITAIGVSFLLEGIMLVTAGPANYPTGKSSWITGVALRIGGRDGTGGVAIFWDSLFVIAAALILMFALQAFVQRTSTGRAMRATAQDRDAAMLSGINVNRTISITFFIGSALAGAGAILYSIHLNSIQWSIGYELGIVAFTAAVLGGIGNIVGAGVGAFLIGAISVFGGQVAGSAWSKSLVFAVLVIILTFRPTGLLGAAESDRA